MALKELHESVASMQAELNSSSKAAPQVARPQIMRTASLQERRSSLGFSSANERNKTSRPATVHRRNFLKGISNFEALTDAQLTEVALHLREHVYEGPGDHSRGRRGG